MLNTPMGSPGPGRIPVVILTGFLGSGKTTLLNALLRDPDWSDSAIVVNEFGDVGLDHLLVAGAKENILLMDAGCLCCAVLDSLPATLADLYHRRAGGDVPPFRRLLVETSGLAEPGPILRTLMRDPVASHFYRPQGLVCVVDALAGVRTLSEHHEAVAQVAMADRLLATKTDLTGEACPPELIERLGAINPSAPIRRVLQGKPVSPLFAAEDVQAEAPWLEQVQADPPHHHHDSDITSLSLVVDTPIAWAGLADWIDHLRTRYGKDLLRCKGILNVTGSTGPVILHGVQAIFDTVRAPNWPDAERRSRIVLIGRGLDPAQVDPSLALLTHG